MRKSSVVLSLALLLCSTFTSAAVIFEDNFDSENGGVGELNYTGFERWNVALGTVDLIGNGFHDLLPGNGLYVDLDGSTGNAGVLYRMQDLDAGDYTLFFDLAGNQRNDAPEVVQANVSVILGEGESVGTQVSLGRLDGFSTYALEFSVDDFLFFSPIINISFGAGGGDNVGMLLDNVLLAEGHVAVSEPATLGLLGIGLVGLGMLRRRQKAS